MNRLTTRTIARVVMILVTALILSACVHQEPRAPKTERHAINLVFQTTYDQMEHFHNGRSRSGTMPPIRHECEYGVMRYIIRAYPLIDGEPSEIHSQEYVMTRDISTGYDASFDLNLPPGRYRIMVWADLFEFEDDEPLYLIESFHEISLYGEHSPNNDYRDAFKGMTDITVESSVIERPTPQATILMERPLAKFEFVTTDLSEFLERELRVEQQKSESESTSTGDPEQTKPSDSRGVSLDDYSVIVHYVGYMPCTYSMIADKPVDSKTGVSFSSKLNQISDDEATMGFDHVFVNGTQTSITVQLELFNKDGQQVSLTDPINVPLKRSCHTVVRGSFLMTVSSGGTGINPEYNGDYNLFF